ncbi:MAG: hypothetical protein KHW79_00295 [Clostridiales bacterium]|nr:hypothetical protein [Clostridiales bacterium]
MKDNRIIKNIALSAFLLIIYIVTYFLAPEYGISIEPIDFFTAAGCIIGICLLFFRLPSAYYYVLALFACAAQYFGMMFHFYERFSFFDLLLHFSSGFLLTMYGNYFCRFLVKKYSHPGIPAVITVLFSVFFAVTGAVIWEIYEFLADRFLGMTSQGIGVADTMEDLIAGSLSAVICGILLFFLRSKTKTSDKTNG